MSIAEALRNGPRRAVDIAKAIGRDIGDTYALLIAAEARGDARVVVKYVNGLDRCQWESMKENA